MYKNNSRNMQSRSSSIDLSSVSADAMDKSGYKTNPLEERINLGLQKDIYSKRISEIKKILGVKSGVQHKEVKGAASYKPEYQEWGELSKNVAEIEIKLKDMPKKNTRQGLHHVICEVLEKRFPDIYRQCQKAAIETMAKED